VAGWDLTEPTPSLPRILSARADISLDKCPDVGGAIPYKCAEFAIRTSRTQEPVTARACHAASGDPRVLMLVEKGFEWGVSYAFAFAQL
jgi:hypothetical protein